MNEPKTLSSTQIILKGQLMVNLPVTLAIIVSAFVFAQFGLGWTISVLAGTGVGWYLWAILLERWKTWAIDNGVDRERLYKLGKWGLLNFYRYKIFEEEEGSG